MPGDDLIFPSQSIRAYKGDDGKPISNPRAGSLGLTKRELFASFALEGMLAANTGLPPETVAKLAVVAADTLLTELDKVKP